MPRYNQGLIQSNTACVGCNRCIAACPVPGANASIIKNGKSQICVDDAKCIHCGRCISACSHNARNFNDDTKAFLDALASGEPISLAVDPSFYMNYTNTAFQILGYLKSLGIKTIYNVALGGDIATWCYMNFLESHPGEGYFSHTCPVILNYMETNRPEYLQRLVPVHSPLICLAIYARKYLGETNKIAYISPCVAMWDEIHSEETGNIVDYNVSFAHLLRALQSVDTNSYYAEPDVREFALGGMYAVHNGLTMNLANYLDDNTVVISADDILNNPKQLDIWEHSFQKEQIYPDLLDVLTCKFGCINGPASGKNHCNVGSFVHRRQTMHEKKIRQRTISASKKENRKLLNQRFADLNPVDFSRNYTEKYQQPYIIPEDTYNEIFEALHKHTEAERHIDCGYCGYSTCKEMAYALAYGYNKKQNCIHYSQMETRRLYLTDTITGIPNNEAFIQNAQKLINRRQDTLYVIGVINVRKFKVINELYGYAAGKNVLIFLAELLRDSFAEDSAYARLHTDFFAVCMPYSDKHLDAFIQTLSDACERYELSIPLSLNLGFCIADNREEPTHLILDHAMMSLSSVQKSNRIDYAFYDNSMRLQMLNEAEITSDMQKALSQKQFTIYLQPQINHANGEITGCEALIRWLHPEKGLISPGTFIPVFEKTGFIPQLDAYVWEEACRVIADWKARGRKVIPISVNISRIDIFELDLVSTFTKLIHKYHINPRELRLEITESAYVEQGNKILRTIEKLREEKFIVEMDDFGSGYSSLNTLKDVPVDVLKLDLKFLSGEGTTRGNIILESIIKMAKRLQLSIVAEGVETTQQADFLSALGCNTIQGYLYSKPIPVEDFEKMADCR